MQFTDLDCKLSREMVENVETDLGISFPESLKDLFVKFNGGDPDPYVFQNFDLNTVVNATLPLISTQNRGTALYSYQLLVVERQIVNKNYFPFAVDAGGDYFFVDCDTADARVYFYLSDAGEDRRGLLDLELTLNEFWDHLEPEE